MPQNMSRSDWIAIAAIIIASTFSSIQILLQVLSMRAAPSPAANQPKQQASQPKVRSRLPYRWKIRVIIFLVNTAATYFLVREILSSAPITRSSVLIIAAEVGIMAICFILPLFLGVYEYIENNL